MHVEIQGDRETWFMDRVFVYHYRIFEAFKARGMEVVSLAIFTDDDENYRPNVYSFERWGFKIRMEIPLVKTVDFKIKPELKKKLETSKNPMALAVKVQLKSREERNRNNLQSFKLKVELMREYYKNGYDRKYIRSVFRFMDAIFQLPKDLDREFTEELAKIEKEFNMPLISNFERYAEERGEKRGEKRGMKKAEKKVAIKMLKKGYTPEAIAEVTSFSVEEVRKLAETGH
jgi:SOS response regulatory protein OraA/RecX